MQTVIVVCKSCGNNFEEDAERVGNEDPAEYHDGTCPECVDLEARETMTLPELAADELSKANAERARLEAEAERELEVYEAEQDDQKKNGPAGT